MKKASWKKGTALILVSSMFLVAVPALAVEDELVGIDADYVEPAGDSGEFFEEETIVFDNSQDEAELDDFRGDDDVSLFDEDLEAVTDGELLSDDDLEELVVEAEAEPLAADIVDSGTCGGNVTWTLDSEGTLTISGTGAMKEAYFRNREDIQNIIISNGVTNIYYEAFYGCSNLTSITIPDSVTSIEKRAFYDCSSLEGLIIPSSITSIEEAAFEGCSSLESIAIPNSITRIEEGLLSGCSSLESITIPDSVTSIGSFAFEACSSLKSITIPSSVTSIGEGTFEACSNLENITIPKSVTSIEAYSFDDCSSLKSITILGSVTSIGEWAFSDCDDLIRIIIPGSVTSIGERAFSSCSSLESITIPDSVTSIGAGAFENCSSLESITIPDSVTSIEEAAFSGCSSLEGLIIPSSITSIEKSVFYGCSFLKSITIPDSVTSIGEESFWGCSSLKSITIPDSVTSIGAGAFEKCSSLESITIPIFVISIGEWAFSYCDNLTSITIPDNVTSIGELAFYSCDKLTIYGNTGSYAEAYALENNIPFAECGVSHKPIIVVSLGDSYASGEGNEPFYGQDLPLSQKVKNKDWLAHRSRISWSGQLHIPDVELPLLYYKWDDDDNAIAPECRWYFIASSGATTSDIIKNKQIKTIRLKGIYNHEEHEEPLPKQIDIFDEIKKDGKHVDYVTLSIGGNDVDFEKIIETVARKSTYVGNKTDRTALQKLLKKKWDNIQQTKSDIKAVYTAIKDKTSPDTIILVTGYPQLLDAGSFKTTGLVTNSQEAKMINEKITAFNDEIQKVVTDCRENENMKIYFVDIETKFKGKQAAWINPIYLKAKAQDLNDSEISAYSVHPNKDGIDAYVECVQDMIDNPPED